MEARCFDCKEMRELIGQQTITLQSGREVIRGNCIKCDRVLMIAIRTGGRPAGGGGCKACPRRPS